MNRFFLYCLLLAHVLCLFLNSRADAQTTQNRASELAVRQGDKRPEDQIKTTVFGRSLTIGGEIEVEPRIQKDFRLGQQADDRFESDQRLELEFLYELSQTAFLFLEGKLSYDRDIRSEDGREKRQAALSRGEMWLYFSDLPGKAWSLRIGRQNFRERREWWWDEDLDALSLHYERSPFELEVGLARELAGVSNHERQVAPEARGILRLLARATWQGAGKQRVEFFFLRQRDGSGPVEEGMLVPNDDKDESDADLSWFGVRAMGRWKIQSRGKVNYWIDTGLVRGEESVIDFDGVGGGLSEVDDRINQDVRGWAVDLGATWVSPFFLKPSFTFGIAVGSGDGTPGDGIDRAYRQMGLQDNNGKFEGVNRFRYYGELLRPELSNIAVGTLALGIPLLRNSSLEILYHPYHQVHPAKGRLPGADIKAETLGDRRFIGQEIDFVLGLEEWTHLEIEFVAAFFRAGPAFGPTPSRFASTQILKIDYNF